MKRWLRRIAISVGIIAATVYLLLVVVIWAKQDSLVFTPSHDYRDLPESHGLRHEDVTLVVSQGVAVRGWFVPAKSSRRGTILFFHGSGGNLSNALQAISGFADAGFDSLSIDYEGYGESTGSLSEANAYRDADAAWSWLTNDKGISPQGIAIWGLSLGGGVATYCAEAHPPEPWFCTAHSQRFPISAPDFSRGFRYASSPAVASVTLKECRTFMCLSSLPIAATTTWFRSIWGSIFLLSRTPRKRLSK